MINQRFLHNVKTLSHNILDRILEGSGDRSRMVTVLNDFYQHLYVSGSIDRICKVSITSGKAEYATSVSAIQFRSGIEVKITDCEGITEGEAVWLVQLLLIEFPQLVRVLISMGFDTWRGKLGDNPNTLDMRLADWINYQPSMNIFYYEEPTRSEKPKALPQPKKNTSSQSTQVKPVQTKNTEFNGDLYGKAK